MTNDALPEITASPAPAREWARDLPPPVVMMGVPFDQVTTPQALGLIEEMIASRRPHMLATANVDFLAQVQEDPALREILVNADLVVCDGTPLVWMSRWLGDPLPERVAGSDLVPLLLDLASLRGYGVYFLGGKEEVVELALRNIRERWPRLKIAGMWSPPFAPLEKMDHAEIRRRLQEAAPDILLVSFGCPKQEKWIAMNLREAKVPVSVGVGATIDFIAGTVKRSPVWMRKAGLEWTYRIMQEPKRLAGRYARDIRIVGPGLLRQLWQMRGRGFFQRRSLPVAPPALPTVPPPVAPPLPGAAAVVPPAATPPRPAPDTSAAPVVLELPERLDALSARDASLWNAAESAAPAWIIADASKTTFIDSTGTGKLVRFARGCRERGGQMILAAPGPVLLQTLALMRLREFFLEAPTVPAAQAMLPAVKTELLSAALRWEGPVSAVMLAPLESAAFGVLEDLAPDASFTIDLAAVSFLDSAAVGLMLRLQRRARQRRVNLVFANASASVRGVLSLLRMEDFLLADPSAAAAPQP